jgi:hypothetical protein
MPLNQTDPKRRSCQKAELSVCVNCRRLDADMGNENRTDSLFSNDYLRQIQAPTTSIERAAAPAADNLPL